VSVGLFIRKEGWRSGLFNSGGVLKTHPAMVKKTEQIHKTPLKTSGERRNFGSI